MLPPAWKRGLWHNGASMITINPCLTSFNVQFLSTRGTYCSWSSKANPRPRKAEQSDAFYVLQKGDIIGIYKSLSGCQAQVSSSGEAASGDMLASPLTKFPEMASAVEEKPTSNKSMVCILEFDGASKGNPGKAGAGAVLRTEEGSVISRVCEGLGIATNNVAEYRALILGLKYALMKGFTHIQVQGDSRLVYMQVYPNVEVSTPNFVINELIQFISPFPSS